MHMTHAAGTGSVHHPVSFFSETYQTAAQIRDAITGSRDKNSNHAYNTVIKPERQ